MIIQFPEPLRIGQAHEYGLSLRIPEGSMRPHYLFSPEVPCNMFDLSARFDPDHLPAWIRWVARGNLTPGLPQNGA